MTPSFPNRVIGSPPIGKTKIRVSSDSAWPLRRADGKTWAEGKKQETQP